MLNKIILMGRLTRDPELRRTESGIKDKRRKQNEHCFYGSTDRRP